jgi:hypothetical protein
MQRHHVRLPDVRGRGGVTALATRALVVTALVGGTGAYLHADVTSHGDTGTQGAERFSAAGLHEVAPTAVSAIPVPDSSTLEPSDTTTIVGDTEPAISAVTTALSARPAMLVHVFHDGLSTSVMTTALTVNGALSQAHVGVGPNDIVHPGRTSSPKPNLGIHVVRVRIRVEHVHVNLGFSTIRKADPHLAKGHSKVVRQGHGGAETITYRVVLHDGKLASRTVSKHTMLRSPLAKVIHYGTKRPAAASRSHRGVDSLNWHALAVCESGDNPRSVGGGGQFFGLYQFTIGTWHSVGGTGNPRDASRAEQTKRAKILYGRRGSAPWPVCGGKLYT